MRNLVYVMLLGGLLYLSTISVCDGEITQALLFFILAEIQACKVDLP